MTDIDFIYTRDLMQADGDFTSSWVDDISYNDNTKELLVSTQDGPGYLYENVPANVFDHFIEIAGRGDSVGSAMDAVMKAYGPGKVLVDWNYFKQGILQSTEAPKQVTDLPKPTSVEVQFTVDGVVKFAKNTDITVDEALADYLKAVELLKLDAKLEVIHVYY